MKEDEKEAGRPPLRAATALFRLAFRSARDNPNGELLEEAGVNDGAGLGLETEAAAAVAAGKGTSHVESVRPGGEGMGE